MQEGLKILLQFVPSPGVIMGRKKGSLNKKKHVQQEVKREEVMTEVKHQEELSHEKDLDLIETEIDIKRLELEKLKLEIEERKLSLRTMSAREVSDEEMVIVKKQIAGHSKNAALAEKIEKMRIHDSDLVTGRFINRFRPGQSVKLTYARHKGDVDKWYILEDNKVYTIPRGFMDDLNNHYHTPIFTQKQGEMDPDRPCSAINEVDRSKKKYAFFEIPK